MSRTALVTICHDARLRQQREQYIQLVEAHQRFATDDGEMDRAMAIDEREHAIHELAALEIADFTQGDSAPQMIVAVGVAPGTVQRALARDFDRQGGCVTSENIAPRHDHRLHVHPFNYNSDANLNAR
jgi:hypothetical protein